MKRAQMRKNAAPQPKPRIGRLQPNMVGDDDRRRFNTAPRGSHLLQVLNQFGRPTGSMGLC